MPRMNNAAIAKPTRRPRFRRAETAPAFRVTDDDVAIVRQIARHRFVRSTHIAALVGRSVDRTNDRLSRLFHAGYIDRPRAQLDYYPTSGSAPMVYALAERGSRLLIDRLDMEFANGEWCKKNREAGRPFIDHQLEIVDFYVSLQRGVRHRTDIRLIDSDDLIAACPEQTRNCRNPLALRVDISHNGNVQEIGLIPDMIFGLSFGDGSRRCFMVEVDRGTMPISRTDITQSSFERKMRAYLAAYAARQHEERFNWKAFRVLTVTTDRQRMRSMTEALRNQQVLHSPGAALFFFAARG
jgi:DNA-binding Lrp family transcriptional regulator